MNEISACPSCGSDTSPLRRVETGLKLRLQQSGVATTHAEVCEDCHRQLEASASQGTVLRSEAAAKEQNRVHLWRGRVNLIKQAKQQMELKQYSDAAVSYEKYIRVLEIVHGCEPGLLTPNLFSGGSSSPELTVITSVYWDLMRVYDSSDQYSNRQVKAAEKLAEFARFTPLFPTIMRNAESYVRKARNPAAYKHLLKISNARRPRCFIATSAFGHTAPEVASLCQFRDEYLVFSRSGRAFVQAYYLVSPAIAAALDAIPSLKPLTRAVLRMVTNRIVKKVLNDRATS